MDSTKNFTLAIFLLTIVIISGISGYMIIEKWNFVDSLYMTIITISTVGYREIHDMTRAGQVFTILLVLFGVGISLYVAGALVQFMIEGRIRVILGRRKLKKRIQNLKNHYIVCGYGRIGRIVCRRIKRKNYKLVVIEEDKELLPIMEEDGIPYILGDATREIALENAGITRAAGLVAAIGKDPENVFLVLTARQLNPDLYIVARAGQESSEKKLKAAGADTVDSPYLMGAISMAQRILRPTVINFLDIAMADNREEIFIDEVPVSPDSSLINLNLKNSGIRQKFNLIIIAINKEDGSMCFNPSSETVIKAGETLIAIGEEPDLTKLKEILDPAA